VQCALRILPRAWDGNHPREEILKERIDWLLSNQVRVFDFCGREPTIHPALPRLIAQVHAKGAKTRVTTNGLALPDVLLETLKSCKTHVKVSLHGEREWHDKMTGVEAFDKATKTLQRASVRSSACAG
jgi:MoaA/NifB/PqqE/SkfB family radical SAM enzyme